MRRGLLWWIARATTSLPLPVSPVIRIVLLVAATVSSSWNSCVIARLLPTIALESVPLLELRAQVGVLRLQPPLLERRIEHVQQLVDLKRLADEIPRAALDRFDGVLHRAVSGDDDGDDVRVAGDGGFDDGRAVDAGQPQVGDDDVEGEIGEPGDGRLARFGLFDLIAAVGQAARRSPGAAAASSSTSSRCFDCSVI